MGRAGRLFRKGGKIRSLEEGYDGDHKVRLGDKDSQGVVIGFIDSNGACFRDLEERDEVRTAQAVAKDFIEWESRFLQTDPPQIEEIAKRTCLGRPGGIARDLLKEIKSTTFHKRYSYLVFLARSNDPIAQTALAYVREMDLWQKGGSPGGEPDPAEVASRFGSNEEKSASFASQVWARIADQNRDTRSENFRENLIELADPRHPLYAEGGAILYPARFKGASINLQRISTTQAEREESRKRFEALNERLREAGLGELPDEIVSQILDQRGQGDDEFDQIVEDLDIEERPVWRTSLEIPMDDHGHSLDISVTREGVGEARRAGWQIESTVLDGPLLEDEIELEITGRSLPPEDIKREALDMLAEGEEHPHVRIAQMFGIAPKETLEYAESIVLGQSEEKSLVFASATVFVSGIGEVLITVSGESEEDVLSRAQQVLPGATLEE